MVRIHILHNWRNASNASDKFSDSALVSFAYVIISVSVFCDGKHDMKVPRQHTGLMPQAAVAAAAGVLSRGGAAPAAAAAAERATSTAEAALVAALPQRLDDFGRDANMEVRLASPARTYTQLCMVPYALLLFLPSLHNANQWAANSGMTCGWYAHSCLCLHFHVRHDPPNYCHDAGAPNTVVCRYRSHGQ